ncbi:autotransporter-associated N-terminal domain-containing protein, partial [Fusobacterium animalis]|uniref:autotransporter-associated N-terminal domain-containing protein n=1 Tax=Fusobacterium animalis TaxID=76859 RepID=UPI0034DE02E1
MDNNLYKVENTLRSIAKRYKSVKYSLGLAILFLMLGVSAFSEDVVSQEAVAQKEIMSNEQIAESKENLKGSIGNLQSKIDNARAENEKDLKGLRLELIQLMEQGDQVIKSPWSSWQFGANYIYNDWRGTYKGKGDKSEKYPYSGVYTRSSSAYERSISTTSKQYSSLATAKDRTSASSNNRNGMKNGYGLIKVGQVEEPIVGFDVSAGVRPKQVSKGTITIADKNPITPEKPEAIRFNTPTISITAPASVSVTAAAPTVTAPTVTAPSPNVPTLPATLTFSPVTPTITAPIAPTVSVFNPKDLAFQGTGFGQHFVSRIHNDDTIIENFGNYTTGNGGTDTLKISSDGSGTTWSGTNLIASGGSTVSFPPAIGVVNATLTPGSNSTLLAAFFSDAANHSVVINGKYEMSRPTTSGKGTIMFVSLNPYNVSIGAGSTNTETFEFKGEVTLKGFNDETSDKLLLGFEHQLLAGGGGGGSPFGSGTSIFKNSGVINLASGTNIVGIQIDTEGTQFTTQAQTRNDGTINVNSKNSIAIDYGKYVTNPPHTKLFVGNINVNGEGNYGLRMKDYHTWVANYYDRTNVTGSNGVITLGGKKNVGIYVGQGMSSGDPISNMDSLQVLVDGTNNVGFLRSGSTGVNTNAITLNAAKLGSTFNFGSTATGGALIRSDINEVILDKDITVGATGLQNSLMQAGNAGKVTLASGKKITSTSADEFYGMTAGNFTGTADGKKAVATNNGELNIGGNKSLGMAIDEDDEGINNGKINFSGTSGTGAYNIGTFTSKSGSEININGQSSIGAFNSGTLTINSGAKIQGTAKDTTGIYGTKGTATNNGTITMTGASVKGLVTDKTGSIVNTGTVAVTGKGAVGAASLEGTITITGGSITADGTSGISLYTGGNVGGTINATGGTVEAKNGAINVFADKGTINFKGATIKTGANSLAFMKGDGTVNFTNPTTAYIDTDGTAFYIPLASAPSTVSYTPFTGIGSISGFNNLSNLTLNMSKNSNVAVVSYADAKVSDLGGATISGLGTILGTDYNNYLLYKS